MKRFTKINPEISSIEYEQYHRKNFFQRKFETMEWRRRNFPVVQVDYDITSDVVMLNKNGQQKLKTIMIQNNIIVTLKKDVRKISYLHQGEKCWLDYENSTLEQIENNQLGKGIRLTKCFQIIEFYGENLDQIYNYLKRYTIQFDFFNYYSVKKKMNHLEFAEVINLQAQIFKIRSKEDNCNYQCITYYKSFMNHQIECQIEKEAYIIRRIKDENIQKFYGIFETCDQIMIITELLIGGSLFEYISKWSCITEEMAIKLFFKLFKTLTYLHSKGIMHRNLKPQNIWLRLNGNLDSICLISFGLADFTQPSVKQSKHDSDDENKPFAFLRCGTPGFIAPEILNNEDYDCKVDVFSAGVVLYYTLTNKLPFEGEDANQIIDANKEGYIDFSKLFLSEIGLNFIASILNIDPKERFSSQIALNHEWLKQEKHSKLMEFKASYRIQHIKPKNPQFQVKCCKTNGLFPQINQKQLSLENSPDSPQLTFTPKLTKNLSTLRFKSQTNSPEPTTTPLSVGQQQSFLHKSSNLSPITLGSTRQSFDTQTNHIRNRLKKSIFKNS